MGENMWQHGKMRNVHKILIRELKGRGHIRVLGKYGRTTSKWILQK
jgi:hypothetical protein